MKRWRRFMAGILIASLFITSASAGVVASEKASKKSGTEGRLEAEDLIGAGSKPEEKGQLNAENQLEIKERTEGGQIVENPSETKGWTKAEEQRKTNEQLEHQLDAADSLERDDFPDAEITDITKASDLDSFAEAVMETEPEYSAKTAGSFSGKRLIVRSEKEFDPCGADSMICGYENLFVLTYETEEDTKKAYELLQTVPDLSVEPESLYDGTAKLERTLHGETEPVTGRQTVSLDSQDIFVAVLDTGYDIHTYGGSYARRIGNGRDLTGQGTIQDANGHGSAMANIILEHTSDCVKVAPVKIADESGRTSTLKLYLGIRYAMELKADIIHISMSAHKAAMSKLVEQAIREARQAGCFVVVSAGNAGENTSAYSPANVTEAIAVSAVNADETRMEYSNYGDTVDYCAYGSIQVHGLHGELTRPKGTSVSAAIVSAIISETKALQNQSSCEEIIALLDAKAKDLGTPGTDAFYGKGLLTCPGLVPDHGEPTEEEKLPELLSCDWQHLSDERLNELLGESHELVVRQFLDRLSAEELQEVLRRGSILQQDHIEMICGTDGAMQYRNVDTLYNYLYSGRLDEYEVQKVISGTYYMYLQNTTRKVYLNTNKNTTKCTLNVKFSGTSTNPADNPTITISGTSAGAVSLKNAKIDGVKTVTDENGHPNAICQVGITGILINKREHSKVIGLKKTEALDDIYSDGLWGGGFTSYGNNNCQDTSTVCKLMVGIGDLELSKNNKVQTYQLQLKQYTYSDWSLWSSWNVLKKATCYQEGSKSHTHTKTCSNCKKKAVTETKTESIARLAHNFANAPWQYGANNGIEKGERYHQCTYSCGTAGNGYDVNQTWWKKDYQYLQKIFYRYMDTAGNYPASYTEYINSYYDAGSSVPGWRYTETDTSEYKRAGADRYAASKANVIYIDVPRKQYRVEYNGNGADSGKTPAQSGIYCGQAFQLRQNGFVREDYKFQGWSKQPDGEVIPSDAVKNLTYVDGGTVTLYARWKPIEIYEILLDSQGAESKGTQAVYEKYGVGYYKDKKAKQLFEGNKIVLPEKATEDKRILSGQRRQKFAGYYTKKHGAGHPVIRQDGTLIPDIDAVGNYRYFTKDSVIYADWQDMYVIQFDQNLTEQERKLIGEPGVLCPAERWKEAGSEVTIHYEKAVMQNEDWKECYRFLGWSLTPKISGVDEILLSEEKPDGTFRADQDVTLYAQWDTSFFVSYIGNGQTAGEDHSDRISAITARYRFCPNSFEKAVEKQTMDIATGQMQNEAGEPYMEEVPCSFQGWGMGSDAELYTKDGAAAAGSEILTAARRNGLSFGAPAADYGASGKARAQRNPEFADIPAETPFVSLYAIWDEYPQILAADLYFPLADAQNGVLTEAYLLNRAAAKDEELKSAANAEGMMQPGEDARNQTSFTIADYQASDFTEAESEMMLTITYRASDQVGNVTTKMVHIYLVDTAGTEEKPGKVRFISRKYADTIGEDSIWRTDAYADKLAKVLNNKKTGEEYTTVTAAQKAFGIKSVLKPGSGTWDHVQQIWKFSHKEILEIQEYVKTAGIGSDPSGFLKKFGDCRVL